MMPLTTGRVAFCLVVIFIAGGAAGAFVTSENARQSSARQPSIENACNRMEARIVAKLNLTEDQVRQLQPIFEQTARDLRAIHRNALRQSDEAILRAHQQIALYLTADQQTRLEALNAERRDWLQRRFKDGSARPRPKSKDRK
jgi:hypothetical protein